ncbi:hypothetical protein [Pedobacter borealis]|nr:hypothetical protein [Pedobacter borealis]
MEYDTLISRYNQSKMAQEAPKQRKIENSLKAKSEILDNYHEQNE